MQVKPRFESYSILEAHPIVTDDTGNEMCLTLVEAKLHSDSFEVMESSYRFWVVMGKKQVQWASKAVSYESIAYWNAEVRSLFKGEVNGFLIEELSAGTHALTGQKGLRTKFEIIKK